MEGQFGDTIDHKYVVDRTLQSSSSTTHRETGKYTQKTSSGRTGWEKPCGSGKKTKHLPGVEKEKKEEQARESDIRKPESYCTFLLDQ